MPQLKNRHEEKCLFPILPLRTYVPKRVCAFTRTQKHMHRVQLINIMPSRFTLAYVLCCLRCRLSGVRSRLHVYGDISEHTCMYMCVCVCKSLLGVGVCMCWCVYVHVCVRLNASVHVIVCKCTSAMVWCYCIIST